jgi:hypothetical protein
VTDSPRKTKVAEQAIQKQPRKNSTPREYMDGFRVWSDHEEKELGTKNNVNIVETSIRAMPVVGVRDNHKHPGSPPLCSKRASTTTSALIVSQARPSRGGIYRWSRHKDADAEIEPHGS